MNWSKTFCLFSTLLAPVVVAVVLTDSIAVMMPAGAVVAVLYIAYLLVSRQQIRRAGRLWKETSAALLATAVGFGAGYCSWLLSEPPSVRVSDWYAGLVVTGLEFGATAALMTTVFAAHFLLSRDWRKPEPKNAA